MPYEEPKDAHAKVDNPKLHAREPYPCMMYPIKGGKPVIVQNDSERKKFETKGWTLKPVEGFEDDGNGSFRPVPGFEPLEPPRKGA